MSRGNQCSLPGLLTPALSLMLQASCFSPTGSAASSTDSDTSTGLGPTSTSTDAATSATTGTSDATRSTDTDTSTTGTSTSTSTEPGTTDTDTSTTTSSTTGPGFCGDGVLQPGEACDDGPDNGDARPCRGDCTLAVCGDALLCDGCTPAETCDDGNQIGDDACDLECQPTTCGDKVLDAGEECDDGNPIPGDGCSPRCLTEQQFIFISSVKVNGDFNGLAAADQLCAGLAAPHFNPRREFVAWLSDANSSAAARIGVSDFAYKTPKGVLVAANTQDLLDGSIAAPILETEESLTQQPGQQPCDGMSGVWTGSISMGQGVSDTCGDWHTIEGLGLTGNFALLDGKWTQNCNLPCSSFLRVYCVEKAL